jgi:hypothetical protein
VLSAHIGRPLLAAPARSALDPAPPLDIEPPPGAEGPAGAGGADGGGPSGADCGLPPPGDSGVDEAGATTLSAGAACVPAPEAAGRGWTDGAMGEEAST